MTLPLMIIGLLGLILMGLPIAVALAIVATVAIVVFKAWRCCPISA